MYEPQATIRLRNSQNGTDNSGMCVTPHIVATDKLLGNLGFKPVFCVGELWGLTVWGWGRGEVSNINIRVDQWKTCADTIENEVPIRVIVENRFPGGQVLEQWGSGGQGLVRAYPEFFGAVGGLGEGVADWVWWEASLCDLKHVRQMWANLQPRSAHPDAVLNRPQMGLPLVGSYFVCGCWLGLDTCDAWGLFVAAFSLR